jgi:hypothetical protein
VLRLRSRGGSGGWGRRRQAGPGCQRDKIEGRGSWADVCWTGRAKAGWAGRDRPTACCTTWAGKRRESRLGWI